MYYRWLQINTNYVFDYRLGIDFDTQFIIHNHGFQAPTQASMQAAAALPPAPCATARGTAPSAARRSPRRTLCWWRCTDFPAFRSSHFFLINAFGAECSHCFFLGCFDVEDKPVLSGGQMCEVARFSAFSLPRSRFTAGTRWPPCPQLFPTIRVAPAAPSSGQASWSGPDVADGVRRYMRKWKWGSLFLGGAFLSEFSSFS